MDEMPVVARYHGIEALQAPMLSQGMIRSLNEGTCERHEIACGLDFDESTGKAGVHVYRRG